MTEDSTMNKIVRSPDRAEGGLTADERRKMEQHTAMWIARAMRTDPIEPDKIIPAIHALYAAADLPTPRVVIVPSPIVGAFAYGAAAAIWCARKTGEANSSSREATGEATYAATGEATRVATDAATDAATYAATYAATSAATRVATDAATYAATHAATSAATRVATGEATYAATDAATRAATSAATRVATDAATYAATRAATSAATGEATDAATRAATEEATRAATYAATDAATYAATYAATRAATDAFYDLDVADMIALAHELGIGTFGLMCAQQHYNLVQGGNQWSAWDSFITFFHDVAKLPLDYSKYQHWRTLSERSGPRWVHPEFCIISDRPAVLQVDDQNRPHREDGPFCQWRDGTGIYAWHGVRVPARWIADRANLDPREVIKAANVEERAAGAAIVGWPKMLGVLKAKVINDSGSPDIGQLIELKLPGLSEPGRFLKAVCPRNGVIVEGVPRISDIDNLPIETALHAQAWRIGDPLSEYQHPARRT